MKEKYAHQDDEDRELAMQILAPSGDKARRRQERKEKKAARKITSEVPQPELPDGMTPAELAYKISHRSEASDAGGKAVADPQGGVKDGEAAIEADGSKEESGVPPEDGTADRGAPEPSEKEEIAEILAEENIVDLSEADREKLTELDSLTGIPRADDLLLFAIPVCAPYAALNGYKYRVKLTPGRQKKGKAAKEALDIFGRVNEATSREKELIRAVTDTEAVSGMVGPVQISMPGLAAAKAAQRKAKKQK